MIRHVLVLAAAAPILIGGCAGYQVALWNDTNGPLQVAIVERWADGTLAGTHPQAAVAPGGWFEYEVQGGRGWTYWFVEMSSSQTAPLNVELTGREGVQERVTLSDGRLILEPITSIQSRTRHMSLR